MYVSGSVSQLVTLLNVFETKTGSISVHFDLSVEGVVMDLGLSVL